ncbi:chemotaxis protein CheA [Pirellulaceae bacterium SH501]
MSDDFNFSTGMPSDEMAQYIQMFVDETSEQLDSLVEVLLVLESEPESTEQLTESFRLVHSIKGASAMMGLDSITLLTHHLENHFENLRSGSWKLDKTLMNLILKCVDFLRNAVEMVREGRPLVSNPELIEQLAGFDSAAPLPESKPSAVQPHSSAEVDESVVASPSESSQDKRFRRLTIYFDQSIELPELKAELILARLSDVAVIHRLSPDIDELGALAELRTLQVWLASTQEDDVLQSAVDIVGVDFIELDPVDTVSEETSDFQGHDSLEPLEEKRTDELHAVSAIADASELSEQKPTVDGAKEVSTKGTETLRVDIQRLDRLMNLAGELVVNRARLVQLASQMNETFKKSGLLSQLRDLCDLLRHSPASTQAPFEVGRNTDTDDSSLDSDLIERQTKVPSIVSAIEDQLQTLEQGRRSFMQMKEAIDQFSQISDGLQRGVLDTRMVPIGPLFSRFKRTVRDISSELGKKVHFVIRGEKTELDKRMIDELGDPLVHLVRNAIDHGLEPESVRLERSKPEAGTLILEAAHSGNQVQITISDDGGGINTDKVKRRAIERGLITALEAESMSEHEIAQFIWSPGFSTADVVSDISGRGVGMDIVKTRIHELNGTIEVSSELNKGTKFIIRLPLTLAIIRSLLFQLPQGIFAAPIENVREIVSVRDRDIVTVHGRDSIEIRGEFLPLVRIEDIFDWHETEYPNVIDSSEEADSSGESRSVLILTSGAKSMGLLVRELKGSQHIVVKSLEENFVPIRGLAGASILGDGSVCLLLDVASCVELARGRLRDKAFRRSMANT